MLKKMISILSWVLILILVVSSLTGVWVTAQEAALSIPDQEISAEPEETVRLISREELPFVIDMAEAVENEYVFRDMSAEPNLNTLIFRNADGVSTMRVFDFPVKYQDKDGEVRDITPYIVADENGGFVTEDNSVITSFSKSLNDGIALNYGNANIRMIPLTAQNSSLETDQSKSVVKTDTDEGALQQDSVTDLVPVEPVLPVSSNAILSSDRLKVSYPYGNKTTLEYSLTYTGFKEDIVVNEYTGQTEYSFVLCTGGLELSEQDGAWVLTDEDGNIKASVGDIIIFTADEANNTFGSLTAETVRENEQYLMTVHVDSEWLQSEKTVYPIRIDPSVSITYDNNGSGAIEDVTLNNKEPANTLSGSLYIGRRDTYGIGRVLMRFPALDLSVIPSADAVSSAYVEIRDLMCETEAMTVYCHTFTGNAWSESSGADWWTADIYSYDPTPLSSKVISYANGNALTNKHRYSFYIADAVKGWKSGEYDPNAGILFKADKSVEYASTSNKKTFAAFNRASNKPSLTVNYTEKYVTAATNVLNEGDTLQLSVANVSETPYCWWFSNNSDIASVDDSTGLVTALKPGKATIGADVYYSDGYDYLTFDLYVRMTDGVYVFSTTDDSRYLDTIDTYVYENTPVRNFSWVFSPPQSYRQLWRVDHVGKDLYSLRPINNMNTVMQRSGQQITLATVGQKGSCDLTRWQKWSIGYTSSGYVVKCGGSSDLTMQIKDGDQYDGYPVSLASASGSNDKWTPVRVTYSLNEPVFYDMQTKTAVSSPYRCALLGQTNTLESMYLIFTPRTTSAAYPYVTWSSSDTSVATVNSSGAVTGVSIGTALITASFTVDGVAYTGSYTVSVQPVKDGNYYLRLRSDYKYIQVDNDNEYDYYCTENVGMELHTLAGASHQYWSISRVGNGYYKIINYMSSYALTVPSGSTETANVQLVQSTYTGAYNQQFTITALSGGGYKIKPRSAEGLSTDLVLAAPTASVEVGTAVQQRAYTSDTVYNDEWYLVAMLPTSGYELDYGADDFDGNDTYINNCYSYAINGYDWRDLAHEFDISSEDADNLIETGAFYSPGELSGFGWEGNYCLLQNLSSFMNAVEADFALYNDIYNKGLVFKTIGQNDICPVGCYKVALLLRNTGYHWLRQDDGGFWSQKNGRDLVKQVDDQNALIIDPMYADVGFMDFYIIYFAVQPWFD